MMELFQNVRKIVNTDTQPETVKKNKDGLVNKMNRFIKKKHVACKFFSREEII